ncbi:MAG: flagellar hook-associated protein FlgK [Sphingobium sp.]|nr:flagellar hook-associated protein FlgK [Sphingobium sp.]
MPQVDLFQIGASGTRAYQAAMGAVADNIANTNTAGYSRRNLEIRESSASASSSIFEKGGASFAGVDIGRVFRASDPYLDAATRRTANTLGSADQRSRWMTDIQTALDDGPLGVGQRMGGMFSTIERLAANPTDRTLRTDMLFSMEQVNTAFKLSYGDMKSLQDGISTTATSEVAALNDAIKQLATANEGLRRAIDGSPAQVQLFDARDQALLEISKRLDVTTAFDGKGIANVDFNGSPVVSNVDPHLFAVSANADGTLAFTLDGAAVATPSSGALAGLAQSADVAKTRVDDLNTLAQKYVTDINTWHTAGFTAAGAAGQPILSIGADASTLQVLITDPAEIASANAAGVINGNLVAASSIRGSGSMEDNWTQIISSQGNIANAATAEQKAASNRDTLAQQARGDVSGVNLDREAADLLRLQQAYQGCARIIQVAREITQTIFDVFR